MEVGPRGKQVQLEDPDGNPIELFQPTPKLACWLGTAEIGRPQLAQRLLSKCFRQQCWSVVRRPTNVESSQAVRVLSIRRQASVHIRSSIRVGATDLDEVSATFLVTSLNRKSIFITRRVSPGKLDLR